MEGEWREVQSVDIVTGGRAFSGDGVKGEGEEDDGVVDGTEDVRTLGRQRVHHNKFTTDDAYGSPTAAGELTTKTARGDSPRSLVVVRKAAPRGLNSPAETVLCTQAFVVSKHASNWGEGSSGGAEVWCRLLKKAGVERRLELTP